VIRISHLHLDGVSLSQKKGLPGLLLLLIQPTALIALSATGLNTEGVTLGRRASGGVIVIIIVIIPPVLLGVRVGVVVLARSLDDGVSK
jgi:hypothetical protein